MREELKEHITNFLDNFPSFFHSEAEIQVLLAQHLINTIYYDNIFVEYYIRRELIPEYLWDNNKKISVDIVVQKNNNYIPIEIKFKTKRQVLPYNVFGYPISMELADQDAHNEGCYSFWKDVKRIEILKETFNLAYLGLVLFITNDSSYQRPPARQNTQYGPFSIHQDRQVTAGEFLDWDATRRPISDARATQFPGFSIEHQYKISWQDLNIEQHKYILM